MTVFNILSAAPSAKYSWVQLAAVGASLVLATVGGKASAAVDCAARTVDPAVSAQCAAHHPHAGVHSGSKAQKTVNAAALSASEGDVLTPVSAADAKTAASAAHVVQLPHLALPSLASRGPSPWSGHGADAGNRLPVDAAVAGSAVTAAATTPDSTDSLHDLMHGDTAALPVVPGPFVWTIVLAGLLGLGVLIIGSPRVARVQSWAMDTTSSADRSRGRAKARGWAVDRVDPDRYA